MSRQQFAGQTRVEINKLPVIVDEPEALDERALVAEPAAGDFNIETWPVAGDELPIGGRD